MLENVGPSVPSSKGHLLNLQRTVGNRAVAQHGALLQVARIMDLRAFKTSTGKKGPRIKVKPVDRALTAYRSGDPGDAVVRLTTLNSLISACDTYLGRPDNKAKRKVGVSALRFEAGAERPFYTALVTAANEANKVQKVLRLNEALELHLTARRGGITLREVGFSKKITAAVESMTPDEKSAVVKTDLAKLATLAADEALPDVTRAVLAEVLANADNVRLNPGLPGAKAKRPWENQAQDYRVTHAMDQPGGEAERLASLTHELTHVSVAETYQNTSLFFMIKNGATDKQIVARAKARKANINALTQILASDTALTADQKESVTRKLDYGSGDKLGLYAGSYTGAFEAAERDHPPNWEQKSEFFRSERKGIKVIELALADSDCKSGLLVEYDTVINQILVYMHMWNVPADNPLYTKIRQVALEAHTERSEARAE